jgi:hypothetical protein
MPKKSVWGILTLLAGESRGCPGPAFGTWERRNLVSQCHPERRRLASASGYH